jgi:hypothetical protein
MNEANRPLSVRNPTASTKPAVAMKSVASRERRRDSMLKIHSPTAVRRRGSITVLFSLGAFPQP